MTYSKLNPVLDAKIQNSFSINEDKPAELLSMTTDSVRLQMLFHQNLLLTTYRASVSSSEKAVFDTFGTIWIFFQSVVDLHLHIIKKATTLQQLLLFCCITLAAEYVFWCTNYWKFLGWNKLLQMQSSWFWNHNISTIYYYFYKIPKVIRPYCRFLACQRLCFKIKTISELQECQNQSWTRFVVFVGGGVFFFF